MVSIKVLYRGGMGVAWERGSAFVSRALMPLSVRMVAASLIDVSGQTVIAGLLMSSLARIARDYAKARSGAKAKRPPRRRTLDPFSPTRPVLAPSGLGTARGEDGGWSVHRHPAPSAS